MRKLVNTIYYGGLNPYSLPAMNEKDARKWARDFFCVRRLPNGTYFFYDQL